MCETNIWYTRIAHELMADGMWGSIFLPFDQRPISLNQNTPVVQFCPTVDSFLIAW